MTNLYNTKVLIIDDEELVRNDIEEILSPTKSAAAINVINATALLSNKPVSSKTEQAHGGIIPLFKVDKAPNGAQGVRLVAEAMALGKPYAVIFIDVRMPGLDGLKTALQIREHDRLAEIIFITAFSDQSIENILEQAGEHIQYHCKPYTPDEIIMLATHAAAEYNRMRGMESLVDAISVLSAQNNPEDVRRSILTGMTSLTNAANALMLSQDDQHFELLDCLQTVNDDLLNDLFAKLGGVVTEDKIVTLDNMLCIRIQTYIALLLMPGPPRLRTETRYRLHLFIQQAEQAIRNTELNMLLIQREKLSAVGQAVAMVTHDLRMPIKGLKMVVELIRRENISNQLVDILGNYANQASAIFDDFIDFIQGTPVGKTAVDLNKLVISVTEFINSQHYGVTVLTDNLGRFTVMGDESKLKRIFLNILTNAAETLQLYKIVPAKINISATEGENPGTIDITIRDNGPGIPLPLLNSIFEPFVTSGKKKGTGLGLAIVQQYVNAHGATVHAANDNGAVFTIRGVEIGPA